MALRLRQTSASQIATTLLLAMLLAGCLTTRTLPNDVAVVTGVLKPLPIDKVELVAVTEAAAKQTVLDHVHDAGWPDPAMQDGHCVLLAWFERSPMSHLPDPGPPSAVYLVGLVGGNDPGKDGMTWVMVDAHTGELGSTFGGPLGISCT